MTGDRPLCVKVQLTDGDMGETVTETVVIHPAEGEDKLKLLNDNAKDAVRDATRKMNENYGRGFSDVRNPEPKEPGPPHQMCPKCQGHGGVPGDVCERCEGTGREDRVSNL